MVGKKRNGAPMSKKMLDARKSRLLGKQIKNTPNENIQNTSTDKISKYYLIERENGFQIQHKDNK